MISVILLVIGFALVIKSADWLVAGSSSVALKYKVSPLVIGMTIVAFGTSFPELIVNAFASFQGNADITLGNIIGSNISNIWLILGVASIIYPLKVQNSTTWKEIPFSLLAVVVLWLLVQDTQFNLASANIISRADGMILMAFFVIFLYYMASIGGVDTVEEELDEMSSSKSLGLIVLGGVGLFLGGKWVVDGAVELAAMFGISQRIIGLTIVAIGTSLPELATSAVAALKKKTDIAIGNVVGSNIFNIFWILSVSSLINPVPVPGAVNFDILVLMVASLMLFGLLFVGRKFHLTRWEGGLFVLMYVSYLVYIVGFS